MKLILTWILHATALLALAHLYNGVEVLDLEQLAVLALDDLDEFGALARLAALLRRRLLRDDGLAGRGKAELRDGADPVPCRDARERIREPGLRVDVVQFAGLEQRRDAGPMFGATVATWTDSEGCDVEICTGACNDFNLAFATPAKRPCGN